MSKYFVESDGHYIGGFEGAQPPSGAIEVSSAPAHALDIWNFENKSWIPYQIPAFESFRSAVEMDFTIGAGKRIKLLQLYELMVQVKEGVAEKIQAYWSAIKEGVAEKIQAYWSAIKEDPDYAWLDAEIAAKVEAHAVANKIPLVAK